MTRTELLAVAKPILFNTEMVRAILEGRKTATRRVIKYKHSVDPTKTLDEFIGTSDPQLLVSCAPYKTGDVLWLRETWCWCPCWDCGMNTEKGCCDDIANRLNNDQRKETGCYGYRASFETGELPFDKWHPSIHMPKEAARLFLRVTDVRVERLQDIDDEQIEKEGVQAWSKDGKLYKYALADVEGDGPNCPWANCSRTPKDGMKRLWDSTINPADITQYGWDANPWVWVIEFERVVPE